MSKWNLRNVIMVLLFILLLILLIVFLIFIGMGRAFVESQGILIVIGIVGFLLLVLFCDKQGTSGILN